MRRMEEIDFFFFWRNLRKHYLWIVLAGVLCGVSAYLVCRYLVPPTYKAEISLFAWGGNPKYENENHLLPSAGPAADDADDARKPRELTQQDIIFGNLLVNDYKELLGSRNVSNEARRRLNLEYPELAEVPYRFEALVLNKTRFIKVSVFSQSTVKAEKAAQVIAEVFSESVEKFMKIKRVQVVDSPQVLGKVSPKTARVTVIAFLLGAGFVFGLFCLYDFFRYTLRNSDIVKAELDLPTIGMIGTCSEKQNANLACLTEKSDSYCFNHILEDFLLLQTNLQYSLPKKNRAQILVLTSAFPKDGKSFTSLNLALTLCGNSKRVLLINCDLRKAEYDYLDLPRQPGLVNFLLGEKKIDEVIHKNVLGTPLSVIRSGPIPPNPTRLLEIFQTSGILDELATRYDYIILDSPPCMNMADPLLLSKLADGTILVVNSRRTPVDAVRQVVDQLRKFDVNILGVVLNRYSAQTAGYGYGYGYGYGESKSSRKEKAKEKKEEA